MNTKQAIEKIHAEFFSSADELLMGAEKILNSVTVKNKGERLINIGFKKSREAVEYLDAKNKVESTNELVETINHYKREYPLNKFITEGQVESICKRYGLVMGDVSDYTGFVPENKLAEIESFRLKEKCLIADNGMVFENAEVRGDGFGYCHIFKIGETDRFNYAFQSNDGTRFYAGDDRNIFGYRSMGFHVGFSIVSGSFKICAPLKDFDIEGKEVKGFKLFKKPVPDPVVLCPVKKGYLIVAAWGDEASDPDVVNGINN